MEITINECPIWKTPAVVDPHGDDSLRVNSVRTGGLYVINGTETLTVERLDDVQKALLTSWLIRNRAMGNIEPTVPEWLADGLSRRSVHQRADYLLKYIESQLSNIGDLFVFETHISHRQPNLDNPSWQRFAEMLAWSESLKFEELKYLLNFLQHQAWLEYSAHSGATQSVYSLTVEGYSHLAELQSRITDSSQAFVAMWFHPSLDDAWEKGIKPAIKEAGYSAMRIDKKEHLNKIDDEIIAEIRRSKFLVADFTEGDSGTRGGVYYEAGFAQGLNIPVLFTCHKDSLEKIHFDTRQYPYIVWKSPEELRLLLTKRISAVLGDGPNKTDIRETA